MKYADALLYGTDENRTLVQVSMGVPDLLAVLDDVAKMKPHIAIVNDEVWIWSVSTQTWIKFIGASGGNGGGDPSVSLKSVHTFTGSPKLIDQPQENNLIWMILLFVGVTEAAVRIGTTLNGEEIMLEQAVPGGVWIPIMVQMATPVGIHVTGVVGQATVVLYKEIII